MNIFLIQPNWHLHREVYPNLGSVQVYQPLDLCYLAALLRPHHRVALVDAFARDLSPAETAAEIAAGSADVVIIPTANTYLFWRCCFPDLEVPASLIRAIRKATDCRIIVYGPHGTQNPRWTQQRLNADILFRGEPELAAAAFLDSGLRDERIPGIYIDKRIDTGLAVVSDLTDLPAPDYTSLDMGHYGKHAWITQVTKGKSRGALIEYSRGCVYACAFCFRCGFREKYRAKSIPQIMDEVSELKDRYQVDYLFFIDDLFNLRTKRFLEFLEQLGKAGLEYGCQCRPDLLDKKTVDAMAASGCIYLELGLESLNPAKRKQLQKNENLLQTMRIVDYARKRIGQVALNLLDFTTYQKLIDPQSGPVQNSDDGLFKLSGEKNALETLVIFPGTKLAAEASQALGIKAFGWQHTIRLYWLQTLLKKHTTGKPFRERWLRFMCLHFPFRLLKKLMELFFIKRTLPLTYARANVKESVYGN